PFWPPRQKQTRRFPSAFRSAPLPFAPTAITTIRPTHAPLRDSMAPATSIMESSWASAPGPTGDTRTAGDTTASSAPVAADITRATGLAIRTRVLTIAGTTAAPMGTMLTTTGDTTNIMIGVADTTTTEAITRTTATAATAVDTTTATTTK